MYSSYQKEKIYDHLSPVIQNWIETCIILSSVDSTNTYLLKAPSLGENKQISLCIAETQSAGRGRSDHHWLTSPGKSIVFSLMMASVYPLQYLTALPLVVAISIAQTLKTLHFPKIMIKWPNDLWFQEAKLGGILVETKGAFIVIGIGLNIALTQQEQELFQYPVADLQTMANVSQPPLKIDRNELLAELLKSLHHNLALFEQAGFQPFLNEWSHYDALKGKTIQSPLIGVVQGVTEQGLLKVLSKGVVHSLHHADVSLQFCKN